jgi:hypothetical protein
MGVTAAMAPEAAMLEGVAAQEARAGQLGAGINRGER